MNSFLSWFADPVTQGALLDTRPPEKQQKDWKVEEVVSAFAPVGWIEKAPDDWRKFSIRNQTSSGSCVEQSLAKSAEVRYFLRRGEKVPFSAGFYSQRKNYPEAGMFAVDAFDQWVNIGITTEAVLPSQNMSEAQMNAIKPTEIAKDLALPFKIGGYLQFTARQDFEAIASTIQVTGKAVMVLFYFKYSEWTDIPKIQFPYLDISGADTCRHAVTAVDAILYKGKKYLVIEDSWGKFNNWNGQRLISEEFFTARNMFAGYPRDFKYIPEVSVPKPKHTFNTDLKFSPIFNVVEEVKSLQDILKYEQVLFDVDSTGYYGAQTAAAVLKFQKKYKVAPDSELDSLGGKTVGPKTREALNQLYG